MRAEALLTSNITSRRHFRFHEFSTSDCVSSERLTALATHKVPMGDILKGYSIRFSSPFLPVSVAVS